jgi:tripartite-type tricarboxylate transporter receptor subunit TctC
MKMDEARTGLRALASAAIAALLWLPAGTGHAQAWPAKPITVVIQYPAGGGSDTLMRIMAPRLGEHLGQTVVVENRPGASGTIGAAYVAKSTPDGYTLLMGHVITNAIAPHVLAKVAYDATEDFTNITYIGFTPNVLVISPEIPVRSLAELIALAKRDPGRLTYASSGNGSTQHLAGAMFSQRAGVQLTHVPYKGSSQALGDVMTGRVTMNFDPMPTVLPHIKSGKLIALAISTPSRRPQLPDVPTFVEVGLLGYDVTNWYAMMGPKGLPKDMVAKIDGAMKQTMAEPAIRERLESFGLITAGPATPEEFDGFVKRENAKYSTLVKELNIRAD